LSEKLSYNHVVTSQEAKPLSPSFIEVMAEHSRLQRLLDLVQSEIVLLGSHWGQECENHIKGKSTKNPCSLRSSSQTHPETLPLG